jgi:hypothetical protein
MSIRAVGTRRNVGNDSKEHHQPVTSIGGSPENQSSRKRERKLFPIGDRYGDRFGGFCLPEEAPGLSWQKEDPDQAQLEANKPSILARITIISRLITLSLR